MVVCKLFVHFISSTPLSATPLNFKGLGRTASDKILGDKTFHITKYSKYDGYQRGLSSMVLFS